MKLVDEIRTQLGDQWIAELYKERVRTQRTRAYHLDIASRENQPQTLHTLLGIELKVDNRRFACPDLATARYLTVFARIGCRDIAVPYDITKISLIADELETSWHQMMLLLDTEMKGRDRSTIGRARASLVRRLRDEIEALGAGESMPAFDTATRQRAGR